MSQPNQLIAALEEIRELLPVKALQECPHGEDVEARARAVIKGLGHPPLEPPPTGRVWDSDTWR